VRRITRFMSSMLHLTPRVVSPLFRQGGLRAGRPASPRQPTMISDALLEIGNHGPGDADVDLRGGQRLKRPSFCSLRLGGTSRKERAIAELVRCAASLRRMERAGAGRAGCAFRRAATLTRGRKARAVAAMPGEVERRLSQRRGVGGSDRTRRVSRTRDREKSQDVEQQGVVDLRSRRRGRQPGCEKGS
jgi:hypothetical protein